ncbi:MAG: class I SAM-dependent methyltransferase [Actinomycetota bacterium]|nr:class I SAM-dependent methyltransferase [Actinomycetota bacterium]
MAVSAAQVQETVDRCPMCGYEQFRTAFEEPPYSVRRCERCGVGWVSPRLREDGLAAIYQDDSYWRSPSPRIQGYADYRADERLYLDTFRRRLSFALRDGPQSGRALDVGLAAGFCMVVLRERGFETHGVEVSETIGRHARDHFGFDTVHFGTLESSPYPDHHFDLITMWDVVEHVVDPGALLRKAAQLLAPGGLLVMETQDIDSRFARTLGPRWHHYKHAEHIYHFTPPSVTTLLHDSGFETLKLTHRYGGKYVSMGFIAERAARLHPAVSFALRPLTAFPSACLYLNFMDEMIVLARPR